jgi:outer membrane receptor protein involved in Fe transport
MRKQLRPIDDRLLKNNNKVLISIALLLLLLSTMFTTQSMAQDQPADSDTEEDLLEEIIVTGTQIKGAAISEALAVSVFGDQEIDSMGVTSGDLLFDKIPEQGQNFQSEAEVGSGGVNSVNGDIGAFNLRNMGTGNTLALLNGRRLVQAAGYQTELVGGSFVPVNTANSNAIPVRGISRVEVLRDGASAIYGADAVAGVINTVMRDNFDGLTITARYDWYDNVPRNDWRAAIEWGKDLNGGRTNISMFVDYYHRDPVHAQDDEKWADADFRRLLPDDSPWQSSTSFRNTYIDSEFGQFDAESSRTGGDADPPGITRSNGRFEVYPLESDNCSHEDAWQINEVVCGLRDGVGRNQDGAIGPYRHNPNIHRELVSDMDRVNVYLSLNHEFDNGTQAYTEFSYYQAENVLSRHSAATTTGVEMVVGPENYYNPFGPCGSPNRVPGLDPDEVSCDGVPLLMDYYRWVEYPRISDTKNSTWRFLQGFRGSWGEWDWDTALVWSEAERDNVVHNRISNNLMEEALYDSTPAAYNPYHGGVLPSNVERALVDVFRTNKTDLQMVDFKLSKAELFNMPAGPVGMLLGAEYRRESFSDKRDPRLNGTIPYTDVDGDTYPFVSDVANSSPTGDSKGDRSVTSLFAEFAIPLFSNFDLQAALRYENSSDTESTTVGKLSFGWRVFEPLLVRGSWSEAFRAPNLVTINEDLVVRTNVTTNFTCRYAVEAWEAANGGDDAAEDELGCSAGGSGVQRRARGSQELVPEKSTNTSIGLVWEPTENLMFTLDFWSIEKKDTIGLFGEDNHALLDTLLHIENGLNNCGSFTGNPAVGYLDVDPDDIPYYAAAGICPVGQFEYVDDKYANLDTRKVSGHDFGMFYSIDGNSGSWDFSFRGTFYDKYVQKAGPVSSLLIEAFESGVFPDSFPPPVGFGNQLRKDGNQTTKYYSNLRWRRDAFGVNLTANYLSSFVQTSLGVRDGQRWVVPSMTTFNASVDYYFNVWDTNSRFRFGINNFTDERAPLADRFFGYFADAHRDLGRYFYVDLRVGF